VIQKGGHNKIYLNTRWSEIHQEEYQ